MIGKKWLRNVDWIRIFGQQEWNISCVGDQISCMAFKYYAILWAWQLFKQII